MADPNEQLIQLITMIRPMASTDIGREAINREVFEEHKVAEETVKVMATLGLIDADALANALASMVPSQPAAAPPAAAAPLSNGAHPFNTIPPPPPPPGPYVPPPPPNAYVQPPPAPLGYDSRGTYGAPPPPGWNAPPPPIPASRQPPDVPAFAQHLPPDQRSMVMAAIAMSQAEIDMLPPPQRAIYMELRSVAGI